MKQLIVIVIFCLNSVLSMGQKAEIFSPGGVAIMGYDPVAFFKQSKAIMGTDVFSYRWKDAEWHFSNEENRADFEATPEKYAPQYGGYCAYGAAGGYKAPTEPGTWTVVKDKLYFNYNANVKKMWMKNQVNFINEANLNWPKIKNAE